MLPLEILKSFVAYNPDSGVFLRVRDGSLVRAGDRADKLNSKGYVTVSVKGRRYYAHRLAWLWITGSEPTGDIDHINGDPKDNRFQNLRVVSEATNLQNQRRPHKNNTTGFLGVSRKQGKFVAQIETGGKGKTLGLFATAEEASQAYVAAKRRLHKGCTL